MHQKILKLVHEIAALPQVLTQDCLVDHSKIEVFVRRRCSTDVLPFLTEFVRTQTFTQMLENYIAERNMM